MLQNRATLKQIRFHLLSELRQIYMENESDSIVRLVMEHLGYPLSVSLREPDLVPDPPLTAQINAFVADIRSGLPIQYILGQTNFCGLNIKVDKRVLIPRPETEEMVEHIKARSKDSIHRIIDLGTGSGCIALALKKYFPDAVVWGVDKSQEALRVAGENGRKNNLQVSWIKLDLLNPHTLEESLRFDLVVSNPPYVMNSEREMMPRNVIEFEPESALFVADEDPLIFYRAIASFCKSYLADRGEIWVEINEQFGKECARLFEKEGFSKVRVLKDIHEKDRYINAVR
ncbi:MAG: peptide chain release factor N(5)-glutamine methyltransferase [Bacteroidetes bacterium]|nr:MAG: peptide chain release factor N(5)-glutamine methyltransferase [Bacteroidota bacterium]RLD95159.1 MAG: peptide chain release factor N(5)-glutamine methyltransferase [Bacteroidota bacterium]